MNETAWEPIVISADFFINSNTKQEQQIADSISSVNCQIHTMVILHHMADLSISQMVGECDVTLCLNCDLLSDLMNETVNI